MDRGDVYHSPNHEFEDGGKAKKLLILLNTPAKDNCYIFVKTTSKNRDNTKKDIPACYSNDRGRGYYVIGANEDWFDLLTWVLFDPVIILSDEEVLKEATEKGNLIFRTRLKDVTIRAITNCMKISPYVNGYVLDLIC